MVVNVLEMLATHSYNEPTVIMASVHISAGRVSKLLSSEPFSSGLVQYSTPAVLYVLPTSDDLKCLVDQRYDEYFEPPTVDTPLPSVAVAPVPNNSNGVSMSVSIDQSCTISKSVSFIAESSIFLRTLKHCSRLFFLKLVHFLLLMMFRSTTHLLLSLHLRPLLQEILIRLHHFLTLNHMNNFEKWSNDNTF